MKNCAVILLVPFVAVCFPCQVHGQGTLAPLHLFTSDSGNIIPLENRQLLEVGQSYDMTAVPDSGFVFSSWQPVNVFTDAETPYDSNGYTLPPILSVISSPVSQYRYLPALEFAKQPEVVILDVPGVIRISQSSGWWPPRATASSGC